MQVGAITCVLVGGIALSMGFRVIAVVSLLIAILVGWKRNWCIGKMEELLTSGEHSTPNTIARADDVSANDGDTD